MILKSRPHARIGAMQRGRFAHRLSPILRKTSDFDLSSATLEAPSGTSELGPRDDDVLPADLGEAIKQAADATAEAIGRGNSRCQVELLLTEFWDPISGPIFPNRGDQERFWKITKRFIEDLQANLKVADGRMNVVYPDSGVAAMLSYQWRKSLQDEARAAEGISESESGPLNTSLATAPPPLPSSLQLPFRITSLNDRLPVQVDDEVIVVACPDPQGAEETMKLVRSAGEQDEKQSREYRPIVLFNPRLSSGDVGLGLNARRMRENFTKNFTVTYSLRPIGDEGSVYRRYPGLWKVFMEDESTPGRYKLIKETPSRPGGMALDFIIQEAAGGQEVGPDGQVKVGVLDQIQNVMKSMRYFMKSLGN